MTIARRYLRPVFSETLSQRLMTSIMAGDLEKAADLYHWNRKVFSIGGLWPLEKSFFKFYLIYAYFSLHIILLIADFVDVFGSMPLMIANLLETFPELMVGVKMILIRHSPVFRKIVQEILTDLHEDNYRDLTEKKLYIEYNKIGKLFFKFSSCICFFTVLLYQLKPLEVGLRAVLRNETFPFSLPWRMRLFFNITETRTFALAYLYQIPIIYFPFCHAMSVLFFGTITGHAAGQMAVLAYRIRHINAFDSMDSHNHLGSTIRDIVLKHRKIILFVKEINDVLNVIFLEELAVTTFLIGLQSYSVLSNFDMVSFSEFVSLALWDTTVVLLIFVYCINGEYLIRESKNIHDACYECKWYEMPLMYQRTLMICMTRAAQPLHLTAGRFFIFSLNQFTGVMKTAMAYISMLRTVI